MRSNHRLWLSVLGSAAIIVVAACGRSEQTDQADRTDQAALVEQTEAPCEEAVSSDEIEPCGDESLEPTPGQSLTDEADTPSADRTRTAEPSAEPARPAPAPDAESQPPLGSASADTARRSERPVPTEPSAPPAPVTRMVALPEGTSLPLVLTSSVATDTSAVEDPVSAKLASAVTVAGTTAIPEGAVVQGTISEATRSGRVKGLAHLAIRFHTLVIDDERYDIDTTPVTRRAEPNVKKDTQKVAVPAAAGGVIGAIAGGGKGAAIGAAAGAAAGTGAVLATRGDEVRLPAGTPVTTTLSAPLEVTVKN